MISAIRYNQLVLKTLVAIPTLLFKIPYVFQEIKKIPSFTSFTARNLFLVYIFVISPIKKLDLWFDRLRLDEALL